MRIVTSSLLAAFAALPVTALAQTPPATIGAPNVPAPWWMNQPVIPSIGYVRVEVPANRANFSTSFQVVDSDAPTATAKAADKIRDLAQALRAEGAGKVQIQTTFASRPLYEQYRDKDGNLIENRRADKIERYEVQAMVAIEVRDMSMLERTYATVIGAKPTYTSTVTFRLDPDDRAKSALYVEAIKDAARRADLSVEAAGAKRGPVKLIDPTSRACQTDVLAGWPSYGATQLTPTPLPAGRIYGSDAIAGVTTYSGGKALDGAVDKNPIQVDVIGGANAADGHGNVQYYFNYDHNAQAPGAMGYLGAMSPQDSANQQQGAQADTPLPLEPPLEVMTAQACVVYGLV